MKQHKVLHCVKKTNATLSFIPYFLLDSCRKDSQLQFILYIFELPLMISFGLLSNCYEFRLLEGRTTNKIHYNDRTGSFDRNHRLKSSECYGGTIWGKEFFSSPKRPDRPWSPPSLLNGYRGLFNPLWTKRRLLYLKAQFVPRSKHF